MEQQTGSEKSTVTLEGFVQKIIPPRHSEPEKAQIGVHGADDLYREIRIRNALTDTQGRTVALKSGATVTITVEADTASTILD